MIFKNVTFVKSSSKESQCPETDLIEIALMGRSNVGKSSLINALLNRKSLAKTSSVPGKTQLINHYLIDNKFHLVDLPGIGWAKTSKANKKQWIAMIKEYLKNRTNLECVLYLVDGRLPPQAIDIEWINYLGSEGIPIVLVFTKMDKKATVAPAKITNTFSEKLLESWESMPQLVFSSSKDKTGLKDIEKIIESML